MTTGTSPLLRGIASFAGTSVALQERTKPWRLPSRIRLDLAQLARIAAGLHLGSLLMIAVTAWHPMSAGQAAITAPSVLHIAFLILTGTAAALLTLVRESGGSACCPSGLPGSAVASELMAQMSHELRTPLNAVIGFSEVMRRELHGPLGNSRYQEYAGHISESGRKLLQSSEDALAFADAIAALTEDHMQRGPERLTAASLVHSAWRQAARGVKNVSAQVSGCNSCDILCERQATTSALEHLLREAIARAPVGAKVEITGRRQGDERRLKIRIRPADVSAMAGNCGEGRREGLRITLARLLLQRQFAALTCEEGANGAWQALIVFSPNP
jgi:signal transduction histidine kinase